MNNRDLTRTSIREDYFRWLCDLVGGVTEHQSTSYRGLLYALFEKEFYPFVPNDDNRASDGVFLRDEYTQSEGNTGVKYPIQGPCRVLEMMVALARRCEDDIMYSPEKGDQTRNWFFSMIKNLGLETYTDDNFDFKSQEKIAKVIDNMVDRNYSENGDGGLFPLKNPSQDQRKVEIWFQLVSWLNENCF